MQVTRSSLLFQHALSCWSIHVRRQAWHAVQLQDAWNVHPNASTGRSSLSGTSSQHTGQGRLWAWCRRGPCLPCASRRRQAASSTLHASARNCVCLGSSVGSAVVAAEGAHVPWPAAGASAHRVS